MKWHRDQRYGLVRSSNQRQLLTSVVTLRPYSTHSPVGAVRRSVDILKDIFAGRSHPEEVRSASIGDNVVCRNNVPRGLNNSRSQPVRVPHSWEFYRVATAIHFAMNLRWSTGHCNDALPRTRDRTRTMRRSANIKMRETKEVVLKRIPNR